MAQKKYHIVSAWTHPDDKQTTRRLVLTYDSENTTTPILLDEAADAHDEDGKKDQIWIVEQSKKPDYHTLVKSTTGGDLYLSRDKDNKLSLQKRDEAGTTYYQTWWTGHVGYCDLLMTPADTKPQALVSADQPKMVSNALVPTPAVLVDLLPNLTSTSHCWKLVPAHGDTKIDKDVTRYHVPDQCDGTWHNPACPGNPATWTGCTYNSSTKQCTCTHA